MHEGMNDFQVWKQHRKELLREAEQHRLAKELRKVRKRRGSGRSSALGREVRRIADRLRKRFRNSRTRDAGIAGSRPRSLSRSASAGERPAIGGWLMPDPI